MSLISKLIGVNRKISTAFDRLLPADMRIYGTNDFHVRLLPTYIKPGWKIYDIGGGKRPFIVPPFKTEKALYVTGLDIDAEELAAAPAGYYDRIITADITSYRGQRDGDAAISRSTLEHVTNTNKALQGMASTLKGEGTLIIFAPCKNALFARLNLFLPEKVKVKLLSFLYGEQAKVMGFKAYYNHCTPSEMEAAFRELGLDITERKIYWMSNYFMIFAPLHILWRCYQLCLRKLGCDDFCEGFAYVLRKNPV